MASVPLHCNICPKQPVFSDVSHLLTHVGSKGHLSHYFKAQVRAPQNPSIREQLDVYERWYTQHQIEKLLSQRMILKDSKKPNGTARAIKKSPKTSKALSQKQDPVKLRQPPPKADPDNVIDPQLSQLSAAPPQQTVATNQSLHASSPGLDLTSVYQAPPPRMRTFYAPNSGPATTAVSDHKSSTTYGALAAMEGRPDGSDTESEDETFASQSDGRSMYPEPPTTESLQTFLQQEADEEPSLPDIRGCPRQKHSHTEDDLETEEDFMPKTPELKGVYYPGMSLFDSASLDAQRKRNQRKDESLIAQLEQETLEVECNEYIYWPDGSLKMCRFITGDVQSSPLKEDTPPLPPPSKRRRGRKPKGVDTAATKRKPRKSKGRDPDEEQPDQVKRERSLPQTLEWPADSPALGITLSRDSAHSRALPLTEEEEDEWLLNMGEPTRGRCRFTPLSLDDDMSVPEQMGDPVKPLTNPLRLALKRQYPLDTHRANSSEHATRGYPSRATAHAKATTEILKLHPAEQEAEASRRRDTVSARSRYSIAGLGKENIPPDKNDLGSKTNHRYFVVKGSNKPQISTTLPAEMAFAGMATPPVYRISLNPLNPNAHLRQSLPYSPGYTSFRAPGFSSQPSDSRHPEPTRQRAYMGDDAGEDFDPEAFLY
ncbi:MAG: hypothetical protein LQ338_001275 [Usnochroma carphineum]|nr:MAG: hypothetical protein LQ338_001275 [Usnochroma carphineum]